MKHLQPITFTSGDKEDDNVVDFRPKAVECDPKGLSAQEYVNESPPEKSQSSDEVESQNTKESSIPLVSPSQLENSLQDVWEDNANAGKEESEDEI